MPTHYRPPPPKSASKASHSTLCQKCLKRDIYECTAGSQDRPYQARPSRTQQLFNPKLVPKLTNDHLDKDAQADQHMEDPAPEPRGRKHPLDDDQHQTGSAKRSKSAASAYSSSSVSTISTTRSRSRSPHVRRASDAYMTSQNLHMSGATLPDDDSPPPQTSPRRRPAKRRRDDSSDDAEEGEDELASSDVERNTRRRHNVSSPHERGRAPERVPRGAGGAGAGGAGGADRLREDDRDGGGRREPLPQSPSQSPPVARRRPGEDGRRSRSQSRSPFRARQGERRERGGGERAGGFRDGGRRAGGRESPPPPAQRFPRKRSMSPYSKRLALTQAMGRQ